MRKSTLFLSAVALSCSLHFSAYAQNDTSRMDAGNQILNRSLTQQIRIKGEDLERMPFTTLNEALGAWLYGVYTVPNNFIYVVDGNLLSDVNAYSVYDIEEVVLVQNAMVLGATAPGQKQMLLITTRKGRNGFRAAAKAGVVGFSGRHSNFYRQLYAGIDRQFKKLSVGASADWWHDVWPALKGDKLYDHTAPNLDRLRLNTYLIWRPDAHNTIEAHINFTPQWIDSSQGYATDYAKVENKAHEPQNVLTPWIRWHGTWVKGLSNDLQTGYLAELHTSEYVNTTVDDVNQRTLVGTAKTAQHTDHIFLRDRLAYTIQAKDWAIEPSVNLSYEHFRSRSSLNYVRTDGNLGNTYAESSLQWMKTHIWFLTPGLAIRYKNALDIQGGVLLNTTHNPNSATFKPRRAFPYASLGLDILRAVNPNAKDGLKIFGSYAERTLTTINDYTLNDLKGLNSPVYGVSNFSTLGYYSYTIINGNYVLTTPKFWVWQTGATWSGLNNRIQLSYQFERRNLITLNTVYLPGGGSLLSQTNWVSKMHVIAIDGKIVEEKALAWRLGLRAVQLRSKPTGVNYAITDGIPTGDYFPGDYKTSWSFGMVNRLEAGGFVGGLDFVYHLKEYFSSPAYGPAHRASYFSIQNIYAGYRFNTGTSAHLPFELYINGRGLFQGNDHPTVYEMRTYFGVGGKFGI